MTLAELIAQLYILRNKYGSHVQIENEPHVYYQSETKTIVIDLYTEPKCTH